MKKNRFFNTSALLGLIAILISMTGCVSRTPYLDSHFGEAVNLLKAQQVLNPQASNNSDQVKGIDGRAGKSAYDAYQKSFSAPEPQSSAFTIGVGR